METDSTHQNFAVNLDKPPYMSETVPPHEQSETQTEAPHMQSLNQTSLPTCLQCLKYLFLTLHNSDKGCEAALPEVPAGKILCFYNGLEKV